MGPFAQARAAELAAIDIVLTDVDDTLTLNGRLEGRTLDALDRLRDAGVKVYPVTAASAGWVSLMTHMWPIDGAIAENGGLYFSRSEGHVERHLLVDDDDHGSALAALHEALLRSHPFLCLAGDQPYRETCLAFERPPQWDQADAVLRTLAELGGGGTLNSMWLVAWLGARDKLSAAAQMFALEFGLDLAELRARILYAGDSENDEPMFGYFPNSVGVSTVVEHSIACWPRWIANGPGGAGFVEVADALVAARSTRQDAPRT